MYIRKIKQCIKCKEFKSYKGRGMCIKCHNKWYHSKPLIKLKRKLYIQNNKEHIKNQKKIWHKKNCLNPSTKRIRREYQKQYRKTEKYKIYQREYQKRENIKKYKNNYYKKYKFRYREQKAKYRRERLKTDINFRMACNLRLRIYKALKGIRKYKSTFDLLGFSIQELKKHLEKNFDEKMSWRNYGKWHIDHIKPCVSFDLTKKSQQIKCFHYSNLQPLWAYDNIKKGAKT